MQNEELTSARPTTGCQPRPSLFNFHSSPVVRWTVFVTLALLALAVRLPRLDERPMHSDEAVNSYTTGELLAGENYHYDPRDRHGPVLYVLCEPVVRLCGAKRFSELT